MFPAEPPEAVRARFLPHLIKGDLDSVRPEVLAFYEGHGVRVVDLSDDQESTDLHKCVAYLHALNLGQPTQGAAAEGPAVRTIVAVGAHGGRLDHILSSLSTLHAFRDTHLVLCGDGNLTRLVPAGAAVIRPDRRLEGPACGLVPLRGPALASSAGLRWDLDRTRMEIGGLVSTSNLIQEDEVHVNCDVDLVWTTQLRELAKEPERGFSSVTS
jgi:thiamine pyrophosphokinase